MYLYNNFSDGNEKPSLHNNSGYRHGRGRRYRRGRGRRYRVDVDVDIAVDVDVDIAVDVAILPVKNALI